MPTAESASARQITVDGQQRIMTIRWGDSHESIYPFDLLRKECPCALCDDERKKRAAQQKKGGLSLSEMKGTVVRAGEAQVTDVQKVGHYALNFTWHDGHHTGIYSFEFLRSLCPCPACRAEQTG
jgi:DUF971 family protein